MAILGVRAAAHRRAVSAHPFDQRLDLIANFDQVLANFDQVLAQARADAAAWELERAQSRAAWQLKFAELKRQAAINNDKFAESIKGLPSTTTYSSSVLHCTKALLHATKHRTVLLRASEAIYFTM